MGKPCREEQRVDLFVAFQPWKRFLERAKFNKIIAIAIIMTKIQLSYLQQRSGIL